MSDFASSNSITPLIRMSGITKRFGRVTVLEGVRFEVAPGEVHVLAGENGAGKSTLMKILAGVYPDYEGHVEVGGRPVQFRTPLDANDAGVAVIHQELSLIGTMSVADNLFLGCMPTRGGVVLAQQQVQQSRVWLKRLGLEIDPRRSVDEFPIATQQCIEIAKALSRNAKVIVMDEPTSALNAPEAERLFDLIAQLKAEGCGIVYISHKMDEIERLADRITVLRDGKYIGTAPASELPVPKLIQWMVGREVGEQFPRHSVSAGNQVRLKISNLTIYKSGSAGQKLVDNVSLEVARGEIVGLGGLQGSGATELLMALFGALPAQGAVELDGTPYKMRSPRHAIDSGVALLTNDRKETGLVLSLPIIANITLASLDKFSPLGIRFGAQEFAAAQKAASDLSLRAASLDMPVGDLSGGNQQKVAIAKWLQIGPRLLMLDEPTRGIDIGAKREIYELMDQWAASGMAILMITSEMSELLALSDRILVMHRGKITAELAAASATSDAVLAAAMGLTEQDAVAEVSV